MTAARTVSEVLSDHVTMKIEGLARKWLGRLPHPFTEGDRLPASSAWGRKPFRVETSGDRIPRVRGTLG